MWLFCYTFFFYRFIYILLFSSFSQSVLFVRCCVFRRYCRIINSDCWSICVCVLVVVTPYMSRFIICMQHVRTYSCGVLESVAILPLAYNWLFAWICTIYLGSVELASTILQRRAPRVDRGWGGGGRKREWVEKNSNSINTNNEQNE